MKVQRGRTWTRVTTENGISLSVTPTGAHLDFDYGHEGTQLEGLVHYDKDRPIHVDSSGVAEVHIETGDTEVYTENPDQFLSLLRELVTMAEQELTVLQEDMEYRMSRGGN